MASHELVLAGILVAVAALLVVAYATRVPYPIWLVLGGAVLGFVPGVPGVRLHPDLVLIVLLPPLLYSAAFFSSLRDLQRNLRPIGLLSVGLVLFTTFGIAGVAHRALGLSWSVAFVLGAVLSPTDPVAATAIGRRVGMPRRVITVVEGESLVNDSSALIAYRFAVAAVVSGSFSAADAGLQFVATAAAGVGIGLVVGWLVARVRLRIGRALHAGEVRLGGTHLLDLAPGSEQSFWGTSGIGGHGARPALEAYRGTRIVGEDDPALPI
jgi:CPA1 family monovalent cation:H+ antiporter